jgi:YHS domain-containing protein
MNLLSENWVWIALALAGLAYFYLKGRRHSHGSIGLDDSGHRRSRHGGPRHDQHGGQEHSSITSASASLAAIDPVSGAAVRTSDALSSAYRGRIYYFGSKDNRDRFEVSPQQYAAKVEDGDAVVDGPHRRRHGC